MSGVQIGDIIRLAELSWTIYNYGWGNDFQASEQYADFGADVRDLADHLNLLVDVVNRAQQSLVDRNAGASARPRVHLESLFNIVGNFGDTLTDCLRLIESNNRFQEPTGFARNIEWNILVRPSVDRLRDRILLHNSRLANVLKPFEIDLLTRIHEDLSQRITAVHVDVQHTRRELRSLIGILVPSLGDALELQDQRQVHTIPIPDEICVELEDMFLRCPSSSCEDGNSPPLRELADSFIRSFEQSTKSFKPGLTVDQRMPPTIEYISLLKCQFIITKIKSSPELHSAPRLSHWPGYVDALEDKLSQECLRFRQELVVPNISNRTDDMLTLWPEALPVQLFDTVSARLLMEYLMEAPLVTESRHHRKTLKLLRHTGSRDRRYRLIITAQVLGQRDQTQVVDFDITSAVLDALYALPGSEHMPFEVTLTENHNTHKLCFVRQADLFLFQQALTGFKVVDNFAEYQTKGSFILRAPATVQIEDASIQLWIPRRLHGSPVTEDSNAASPANDSRGLRSATPARRDSAYSTTSAGGQSAFSRDSRAVPNWNSGIASSSRSASSPSPGMPWRQGTGFGLPGIQTQPRNPDPVVRSQGSMSTIGPTNSATNMYQQSSPSRSTSTAGPPRRDSASTSGTVPHSPRPPSATPYSHLRPPSINPNSTSSSASDHVVRVSVTDGSGTGTGVIHSQPLEPMLVLFTKNPNTGTHAIVAVSINGDTRPNSGRCKCKVAPQTCRITALEQAGGDRPLTVRRLGSDRPSTVRRLGGEVVLLDVLPLAAQRRTETPGFGGADWRGVTRLSVLFRTAKARHKFGGCWCNCQATTEGEVVACLQKGHCGLLGHVRVWYRRQMMAWHRGRYEDHVEVVSQPMGGDGGFD